MQPAKVACRTHHGTRLWALDAVKRLEIAREDAIGVDTVGTPAARGDVMQRHVDTLAAGEATSVPEEEV